MKTKKKYTKPSLGSANGSDQFVGFESVSVAYGGGRAIGGALRALLGRSNNTTITVALRKVTL